MESLFLAFGVLLLVAALLSRLAHETMLSISVIFVCAGFALGRSGLGWVQVEGPAALARFTEAALFLVLFSDGTRVDHRELAKAWQLPLLALFVGMPLTALGIALAARWCVRISWSDAFLLGAILSPTDPVLAGAILQKKAVPKRVRNLLDFESGLNDGLALPAVVILLRAAAGEKRETLVLALEIAGGVAIGAAVPWLFARLGRLRSFELVFPFVALGGVGVGLTVFVCCRLVAANEFLAAYTAGIVYAMSAPADVEQFSRFGEPLAEASKLLAILAFGCVLSIPSLVALGPGVIALVVLTLFVVRPVALTLSGFGWKLPAGEWAAISWFGPKGFASVLYGLYVLNAQVEGAREVAYLVAAVVTSSILLHSSTDVLVARAFARRAREP